MNYKISFDPQNKNALLVHEGKKLITMFAIPSSSPEYIINFDQEIKTGMHPVSNYILIYTGRVVRAVYLNGKIQDIINV